MKLARIPHDPGSLIEFFQEGLETLGAVCERSWHDRLQLVAEGPAARLWNADGALLERELHFPPAGESGPRNAEREIFPGCPLTFRLAESLGLSGVELQRVCIQPSDTAKSPALDVAERLWHAQVPGTTRWKLESAFAAAWHFSLLVLVRCEIQAIDQHWSLHRLALSLPEGQRDESLAASLDYCQVAADAPDTIPWPAPDPAAWHPLLRRALEEELEGDLAQIRLRQENFLRRELERIDSYFESYERELTQRMQRQHREDAKTKGAERLAAAKSEHERRRHDQVHRQKIRVIPHLDALLMLAEPAWSARVGFVRKNVAQTQEALFVPRARRWIAGFS